MKRKKIFLWFSAFIKFIPVVLIIIMGVFAHRHTIEGNSVVKNAVTETVTYAFNNEFLYYDRVSDLRGAGNYIGGYTDNTRISQPSIVPDNVYDNTNNIFYHYDFADMPMVMTYMYGGNQWYCNFLAFNGSNGYMKNSHKYYFACSLYCEASDTSNFTIKYVGYDNNGLSYDKYDSWFYKTNFVLDDYVYCDCEFEYVLPTDYNPSIYHCLGFFFSSLDNSDIYVEMAYCMLFDLTDIYGVGNEPSTNDFSNLLYDNNFLDYSVMGEYFLPINYQFSYSEIVVVTPSITYNEADIISQSTYVIYNAVDNYFNFKEMFNFNGVYNWFATNMLGGNPPLVFDIVFNLVLYELFVDIFLLIYAFLMFIINFAYSMLDRFYEKGNKGW